MFIQINAMIQQESKYLVRHNRKMLQKTITYSLSMNLSKRELHRTRDRSSLLIQMMKLTQKSQLILWKRILGQLYESDKPGDEHVLVTSLQLFGPHEGAVVNIHFGRRTLHTTELLHRRLHHLGTTILTNQ